MIQMNGLITVKTSSANPSILKHKFKNAPFVGIFLIQNCLTFVEINNKSNLHLLHVFCNAPPKIAS